MIFKFLFIYRSCISGSRISGLYFCGFQFWPSLEEERAASPEELERALSFRVDWLLGKKAEKNLARPSQENLSLQLKPLAQAQLSGRVGSRIAKEE